MTDTLSAICPDCGRVAGTITVTYTATRGMVVWRGAQKRIGRTIRQGDDGTRCECGLANSPERKETQ